MTEKSIGLEGLSPPMALSIAIIWLSISANRSPQSSIKTEKVSVFEGLSPPMALSIAIIWLSISANRSLNPTNHTHKFNIAYLTLSVSIVIF
jgi:hypothetical protein